MAILVLPVEIPIRNLYQPVRRALAAATGATQETRSGSRLTTEHYFDLERLPPIGPVSELVVVSNQQERSPITNDAVSQTNI
jgi:hypothetical protein